MKMHKILCMCLATLIALEPLTVLATVVRNKDPNWATIANGTQFFPLPDQAPYLTGFYSTASSNQLDYKQPEETFIKQALQFKSKGYIETFYETNPTIPISYSSNSEQTGQDRFLDVIKTGIPAYDKYVPDNTLRFDIANGQWLLNQQMFSRFNDEVTINSNNANVYISPLNQAPWGVSNSTSNANRDEFLVALSKIVYGAIESRPVLYPIPTYRYATGVRWYKIRDEFGNIIAYEYREESVGQARESIAMFGGQFDSNKVTGNFVYQKLNGNYYDCYEYVMRGEYVTSPENIDNKIFNTFTEDHYSYVTTNVWELYIFKLLSMGILDYNEVFNMEALLSGTIKHNVNLGPEGDTFEFNDGIKTLLANEFDKYGNTQRTAKTEYPVYAPELGLVISGSGNSIRDMEYNVVPNSTDIFGRNYNVSHSSIKFKSDGFNDDATGRNLSGLPDVKYSKNQSITNIAALRMIERVLRVEEKNMSSLEASIITQKYGAKYLSNIPDADRRTVEYLIALGIIDFENYDEYANLYNVLSREFCFTLLYRVANPNARTDFSKVLLTDSSSAALGMASTYMNYQNSILTNTPDALSKFISEDGRLVHNALDDNSKELSLMSSVYVDSVYASTQGNPIYHVILNVDDPVKYIYREMPIAFTDQSNGNMLETLTNPWGGQYNSSDGDNQSNGKFYYPYPSNTIGAKDQRSAKLLSMNPRVTDFKVQSDNNTDHTGVVSIKQIGETSRYLIDISLSATTPSSAEAFVKANMKPLTSGLLKQEVVNSVITDNKTLMIDSSKSDMAMDGNVINNNIVINASSGISGSKLVYGTISESIKDEVMVSQELVGQASSNFSVDAVGSQPIVSIKSNVLDASNTKVVSNKEIKQDDILVRELEITKNGTDKHIDKFYNVTKAGIGNVLTTDREFKWISDTGEELKANGTIAVELVLNLPTPIEQHSLVGGKISTSKADSELYNWIYTLPDNTTLKNYWDYNINVVDAILKTMGTGSAGLRTGYVYPKITLMIDKPPKDNGEAGLSKKELNQISNEFLQQVGSNLDSKWITTFVGSNFSFNLPVSELSPEEKSSLVSKGLFSDNDGTFSLANPPVNGLLKTEIEDNMPIWAELYFNNQATGLDVNTTLVHSRVNLPTFKIYPILEFSNSYRLFGEYRSPTSEIVAEANPFTVTFAKSEFGDVMFSLTNSMYSFNPKTELVSLNNMTSDIKKSVGSIVVYKGTEWILAEETNTELKLVAKDYIQGKSKDGILVEAKSGEDITVAIKAYIKSLFGTSIDSDVDETLTYNFNNFNTGINNDNSLPSTKVAELDDGKIEVYEYNSKGNSVIKTGTRVNSGESIVMRPYVSLSKGTWAIDASNNIKWQKRFLGADYKFYSPQNNIFLLKADIMPIDATNRIKYSELKQADLTFGTLNGFKTADGYMEARIPFNQSIVKDDYTINNDEFQTKLSEYTTPTITPDGKSYSSIDYANNLRVATYNKDTVNYDKTLVQNNGSLYVATGNGLTKYDKASNVNELAIALDLAEDLIVSVVKDSAGDLTSAVFDGHQDFAPTRQYEKSNVVLAIAELPEGLSYVGSPSTFVGVDNAKIFFRNLVEAADNLRRTTLMGNIVFIICVLCFIESLFLIIARVLRVTGVSYAIFEKINDASGLDIIRIMSCSILNLDDEPIGWLQTIVFSFLLVFIPLLVITLFQAFGVNFL